MANRVVSVERYGRISERLLSGRSREGEDTQGSGGGMEVDGEKHCSVETGLRERTSGAARQERQGCWHFRRRDDK